MISKAQIQFVRSLEHKKFRDESGCFIAEGDKLVREALALPGSSAFQPAMVCGTSEWLETHPPAGGHPTTEFIAVSERELERLSLLKTPNQVVAVIRKKPETISVFDFSKDLLIVLNQVQDPGNVGTLIRLADWFGLGGVVASGDSADFFSPKVVQSSMGSIFRVKLLTAELAGFLSALPDGFPVYGTHLKGKNLYECTLSKNGIILMGNESRGLSDDLMKFTTQNLFIPDFSQGVDKPESLNVSIAAAIVCSEFRRRGNG